MDENFPEVNSDSLFISDHAYKWNAEGKQSSDGARLNYIDKLQESYKTLGSPLSFKDYGSDHQVRWILIDDDINIGNYMIERGLFEKD